MSLVTELAPIASRIQSAVHDLITKEMARKRSAQPRDHANELRGHVQEGQIEKGLCEVDLTYQSMQYSHLS